VNRKKVQKDNNGRGESIQVDEKELVAGCELFHKDEGKKEGGKKVITSARGRGGEAARKKETSIVTRFKRKIPAQRWSRWDRGRFPPERAGEF